MPEKCEQFFLRGVDIDRAWGPFARWRPVRNERVTFQLALAILLPFVLLTPFVMLLVTAAFLWLASWLGHSVASIPARAFFSWPLAVSLWLGFMTWLYPLALGLRALLLSLRVWAWNRRANRLQREGTPVAEIVSDEPPPGVWPPPPTVPRPRN